MADVEKLWMNGNARETFHSVCRYLKNHSQLNVHSTSLELKGDQLDVLRQYAEIRDRDISRRPMALARSPGQSPEQSLVEMPVYVSDVECQDYCHGPELQEEIERSRQIAWFTDAQGGCQYVNRAGLEYSGFSLSGVQGDGWLEAVHPEDREKCGKFWFDRFSSRLGYEMSFRWRRADGAYGWLLDRGWPYSVNGAFAGYAGISMRIHSVCHQPESAPVNIPPVRKIG